MLPASNNADFLSLPYKVIAESLTSKVLHPVVKIRFFAQKRQNLAQNMLSWAHIGLAGSFGALFVGWLVVVLRELYLARQLFSS